MRSSKELFTAQMRHSRLLRNTGPGRRKTRDENFVWDVLWQGLKSVCENSVLEGHGFSRAVNDIAIPGFHGKPGQVSR
jgi:hypothetical protein